MTLALFLVVFALVLALWAALLRYLLGKLTFGRGSGSEPTRPSPTCGGESSGVRIIAVLSGQPRALWRKVEETMPWPDPWQLHGLKPWGRN